MPFWLAYDGGGTHTTAGLYDASGRLVREASGNPCNPVAYGVHSCVETLASLGHALLGDRHEPVIAAAGIAGAADLRLRHEIGQGICSRLELSHVMLTTDLHPLLHANLGKDTGILAVAGTGASVLVRDSKGRYFRLGGRGALIGDAGGAYQIAVEALRAAARALDDVGPATALLNLLPRAAAVDTFEDLPPWAATASKSDIARLAETVSAAADEGDAVAGACIDSQARTLAGLVLRARARHTDSAAQTSVFMHGGVFRHCPRFRQEFQRALSEHGLNPVFPGIVGHAAVFASAQETPPPEWMTILHPTAATTAPGTEHADLHEKTLDAMTALEIVDYMNQRDAALAEAVRTQREHIAWAIDAAARAIASGGRVIYTGAGTSGRLGVLDASECPPTFGVGADRVLGIIAGGDAALRNSVEGAEDDRGAGIAAMTAHGVNPRDLVVGIAASGTTPYVLAALEEAKRQGAATALVCCNPVDAHGADTVIAVETGPEVLAGSTRLKAGTATKMVLNMISTGALARAGYVYRGRMVGMRPANTKLRKRAGRIVAELTGLQETQASTLLAGAGYDIRSAIVMALRRVDLIQAKALLEAAGGRLSKTLE